MREYHKQATCHPERRHAAKGLCFICYAAQYPKAKRATCHPDRIAHVAGRCRSCYDAELKQRDPGYAERQRANTLKWAELNRDRKSTGDKFYRSQGRVKRRSVMRTRELALAAYGLTIEDEIRILVEQGNVCALCGAHPHRQFDIDHDHRTGKFRGFLCHRCNKGLGLLGDTADAIERALAYLRRAEA